MRPEPTIVASSAPATSSYQLRRAERGHVAVCECGWESAAYASGGLAGAVWYEHAVIAHAVIDLR